jgi:hypothetical protein
VLGFVYSYLKLLQRLNTFSENMHFHTLFIFNNHSLKIVFALLSFALFIDLSLFIVFENDFKHFLINWGVLLIICVFSFNLLQVSSHKGLQILKSHSFMDCMLIKSYYLILTLSTQLKEEYFIRSLANEAEICQVIFSIRDFTV